MAVTMRELVTKWGFDVDQKPLQEMGKNIFLAKESLQALFEVAKGLYESTFGLAESAGEYGRNLTDLSERFNITTDRMQEYQLLANKVGVGTEKFSMALQHLQDLGQQFLEGAPEVLQLFSRLGIDPIDKHNGGLKDMNALLLEVSDGLKKHANESNKSALAGKIFGERNAQLIDVLGVGREKLVQNLDAAQKYILVTQAMAEKQKNFANQLSDFKFQMEQIKNMVGTELIPVFTNLIKQFQKWVSDPEGQEFLKHTLPDALKALVEIAKLLAKMGVGTAGMFSADAKTRKIQSQLDVIDKNGPDFSQWKNQMLAGHPFGHVDIERYRPGAGARMGDIINHFHLHGTHEEMIAEFKKLMANAHGEQLRQLQRELKSLEQ